jgi:hypothetical protein
MAVPVTLVIQHVTQMSFSRRALGWRRGAGASLTPTTTGDVETGEQLLSREHSSSRDGDAAAGSSAAAAGGADAAAAPSTASAPGGEIREAPCASTDAAADAGLARHLCFSQLGSSRCRTVCLSRLSALQLRRLGFVADQVAGI